MSNINVALTINFGEYVTIFVKSSTKDVKIRDQRTLRTTIDLDSFKQYILPAIFPSNR